MKWSVRQNTHMTRDHTMWTPYPTVSPTSTTIIFQFSPTNSFLRFSLLPFRSSLLRKFLLPSILVSVHHLGSCLLVDSTIGSKTWLIRSMLIFNSLKHFVLCYTLTCLWMSRYPPQGPRLNLATLRLCHPKALLIGRILSTFMNVKS